MKLCLRCGQKIKESDRFCKFCGFYFPLIDIEEKELVVINVDIEGFTRISHTLELEEVDEILSNVFGSLIFLLESNEAFINQFYGDEIVSILGLSGIKEDIIKKALDLQAKIHYFFESNSILPQISPRIKISMEYGKVLLTYQNTDGSTCLSLFGEAEERAREGLRFIKGGETAIGINFKNLLKEKKLAENVKIYPATNVRNDIFIIETK